MENFDIKSLKDIEIGDKPVFDKYLPLSGYQCCEFNFPNLFNWRHSYNIRWGIAGGFMIIYNASEDIILMPVGPRPPSIDELVLISDTFAENGKSGAIVQVPSAYIEKSPELGSHFKISTSPDVDEYIHLTEKMVTLSGEKLRKKKNLISQFLRNNKPYTVQPLTGKSKDECLTFTKQWQLAKDMDQVHMEEEDSAIISAFDNFEALGIEGIGIFIDNKMIAYSVFGSQLPETSLIYFEKSIRDIKGGAQVINWETAKYLNGKCKYINREQDLGDPGLKHAKSSYDPVYMLKNYALERI